MLKNEQKFIRNAPKLTYGHLKCQNFSGGETPGPPLKGRPRLTRPREGASNAGKGRGGEEGERRVGREWERRGGREGGGKGVRGGEEGKGEGRGKGDKTLAHPPHRQFLDPPLAAAFIKHFD